MDHPTSVAETHTSFFAFIWNIRANRIYLLLGIAFSILGITFFKMLYRYPNMVLDSYFYVQAAASGADINIWPIGYSKFIQGVGLLSHSPVLLVWVQYLFFEFTALYFFFTLLYFFELSNPARLVLFIFLFVNPLFLYCCNLIFSDPLFITLSLLWL